jgi:hypothetical protein
MKQLSISTVVTLGLVWLAPASAQQFQDLNRALIYNEFNQSQVYQVRPGITGCGRDRVCEWQEPDTDITRHRPHRRHVNRHWRHSERGAVNTYRQPQINYDLAVPIEPTRIPLPGRSRLGLSRQAIVQSHRDWCLDRYRSYDGRTDTFQPYHGGRRRCISPYH